MNRTLLASLVLALGVVAAAPTPAAACGGGYGAPSEASLAAAPVWQMLDRRQLSEHVSGVHMALNGDRGRATVKFDNDHRLIVGVVKKNGRWRVAG